MVPTRGALQRTRRRCAAAARYRRLRFEQLESRLMLNGSDLAEVPLLDGERLDPLGETVNYLGGDFASTSNAAFRKVSDLTHTGSGAYRIDIDGTLPIGHFAFVQTTLGVPDTRSDTRDLRHYDQFSLWLLNRTGVPFTLEVGFKDFEDSNAKQARWVQPIGAEDQWIEVRASLDFTPVRSDPAQAGWEYDPASAPDLTRSRSISFTIVANRGSPIAGSIYLDDFVLVEPGGPVEPASAPVGELIERLTRRQFDALWHARDRRTGLVPTISHYGNVLALNTTAALVKSLPGAIERGWVSLEEANDYVQQLVRPHDPATAECDSAGGAPRCNLEKIASRAAYLPARYVDRLTLAPTFAVEESTIDAALLYLALYQYKSLPTTPAGLRSDIEQVSGLFQFEPFATSRGWRMAFDPNTRQFTDSMFDGYTGEIGLISLAADVAGQVDMPALYHSGTLRERIDSVDGSFGYVVHADSGQRAPFMQWLFPLFVDIAAAGLDNYPAADLATNPWENAVAYQRDVIRRLQDGGRGLWLEPDAGNDWEGKPENDHAYSVFNDFGKPSLLMPWSVAFAFLADPAAAEPALRAMLAADLEGPFGLVDSAYREDGATAPHLVSAWADLWNTSLSLMAFQQYLYQDNRFMESDAVSESLRQVFHAPAAVTDADQFLLDSVRYYCRPDGAGGGSVPLYTDYKAGGDYFYINDAAHIALDSQDRDAARGTTSLRATWDGLGPNGYFQFGFGDAGPRTIDDWGFAHRLHLFARGDRQGQQLALNVFQALPGGHWERLETSPAVLTLEADWQEFTIDLPRGVKPSELHAVQFVLGDGRDTGGGTFWLDDVRLLSDGCDPAQLVQSYRPEPQSDAYRDRQVYPNRSFLYDNALAIKALWSSGDGRMRAAAIQLPETMLALAEPDGSYLNQRNAGHAFQADGTPRGPLSRIRTLGDNAWFGLALMDLYEATGEPKYLDAARGISDWAEAQLKAAGPLKGYRGGYDASGNALLWRSTEHNVDFSALNRRLADALAGRDDAASEQYAGRARHAGDFVIAMFDPAEGKFWTGTGPDDSINTASVPVDVQLWAVLALSGWPDYAAAIDWSRPLSWVEDHLDTADGPYRGFRFSSGSTPDRVWQEGTAQAAAAYAWRQDWVAYATAIQNVRYAQLAHPAGDGRGVVAASGDALEDAALGAVYDARLHVGATAWLVLAERRINPFVSSGGRDASRPRALLPSDGTLVATGEDYQPWLDSQPGVNLVSWQNGSPATWQNAVQDAYDHGFRTVSLVPIRFADPASGAIAADPQLPDLAEIAAAVDKAKALDMTVMVNPFVEPLHFSTWRGNLAFGGEAADRFFADYEDYLTEVASLAQQHRADRVTIGSELKGLTTEPAHSGRWQAVIEAVAGVYDGLLGYAANWDEYEDLNVTATVWESPHIDFLAVDLYPPLVTEAEAAASEPYPDAAFISAAEAGWSRAIGRLLDFAHARKRGMGMDVVISEVGLVPYDLATTKPYSTEFLDPDHSDPDEQQNAFDALLRAVDGIGPELSSFYVWHWAMPGAEGSPFSIGPRDPLTGDTATLLTDHATWARSDFGEYRFAVSYRDNAAVDAATLGDGDVVVTGPGGFRQAAELACAERASDGTPRSATYRIQAPGASWDRTDDGVYDIFVQPGELNDAAGNATAAGRIGSFTYRFAPWQNPRLPYDVDDNGVVAPLDVLIVVNELNGRGSGRLLPPGPGRMPPAYHDVNGDNWLAPLDVLVLINHINSQERLVAGGEASDLLWAEAQWVAGGVLAQRPLLLSQPVGGSGTQFVASAASAADAQNAPGLTGPSLPRPARPAGAIQWPPAERSQSTARRAWPCRDHLLSALTPTLWGLHMTAAAADELAAAIDAPCAGPAIPVDQAM